MKRFAFIALSLFFLHALFASQTSDKDFEVFKTNFLRKSVLVPELKHQKIQKLSKENLFTRFHDNGGYTIELIDNDYKKHIEYWNDIYNLAILYSYADYYPEESESLASFTGRKDIYNLIIKSVNWYFDNSKPCTKHKYHDTYTYHATAVIPLMDYTLALLYKERLHDTNAASQRAFRNMISYGDYELDSGNQTKGANWTFRVCNHCFRHVYVSDDPMRMERLMKAVSRSLTMTLIENDKESDGFYPDGMFFHHGDMCYFTMYGLEALQKFNEILQLVEGTKWEFNKKQLNQLADLYLDGVCYSIYRGNPEYSSGPKRASQLLARIMASVPNCKHAMQELVSLAGDKLDRKEEMQQWISNCDTTCHFLKGDEKYVEKDSHKYFWTGDYQVHRRNNFYIACRRSSLRVRGPEDSGTNEAHLHLHYGSGYTPILVRGDEYYTARMGWNWLTLPGTTTETSGRTAAGKAGSSIRCITDFSGGVQESVYGVGGFIFNLGESNREHTAWNPVNGATAYKSNFFFDEGMLCLGSRVNRGYTLKEKGDIVTTLDQKRDESITYYSIDGGKEQSLAQYNESHLKCEIKKSAWFWHSNIGYIVYAVNDEGTSVDLTIEPRELNPLLSKEKDYMSGLTKSEKKLKKIWMWQLQINHGLDPQNQKYAYIVLPNITKTQLEQYFTNPKFSIESLQDDYHVVFHKDAKMYQGVFFEKGDLALRSGGRFNSECPIIFQLRKDDSNNMIAVSNPIQFSPKSASVYDFAAPDGFVGVKYDRPIKITFHGLKLFKDSEVDIQFDNRRNYEGRTVLKRF